MLVKLADVLNTSVDYLLGRSTNKPHTTPFDEALEALSPEERKIIMRIRQNPDMNLFFKDFASAPEEALRDLVKIWRHLHPEDFKHEDKS
ncbi:hypothetical protein CULT_1810011 [[Clostridium] ultunense Esp]|nr:hypothetical protein CULT_1810011 [[Clostridium] ultunense Esp]